MSEHLQFSFDEIFNKEMDKKLFDLMSDNHSEKQN